MSSLRDAARTQKAGLHYTTSASPGWLFFGIAPTAFLTPRVDFKTLRQAMFALVSASEKPAPFLSDWLRE
jgi:hypothetical protein